MNKTQADQLYRKARILLDRLAGDAANRTEKIQLELALEHLRAAKCAQSDSLGDRAQALVISRDAKNTVYGRYQ